MKALIQATAATALWLLTSAAPAQAQSFARGTTSLALMLGAGEQLQRNYTVVSGRMGYYFVEDVEASVALDAWFGNDPKIYKLTPELRYVYSAPRNVKPYVAGFVARSFYKGGAVADTDSYGARVGAYFPLSRRSFLGLGLVHERFMNCDARVYGDCRQTFSELSLHFVF
jgi:hypothetical protein